MSSAAFPLFAIVGICTAAQAVLGAAAPPPPPLLRRSSASAASPLQPPDVGDAFLPPGTGYDWSLAGYKDGLEPIPTISKNVIDIRLPPYNAKGDGESDDTDAIQAALAAAGNAGGGVVYLPAGVYVFQRPVTVRKSGVVIRGDGRARTTIRIPVSLSDVYKGTWVQDPKTGRIKSSWSFGGAFFQYDANVPRSYHTRWYLATITKPVPARSRRLQVSSVSVFQEGQWVRVFVNDASTSKRRRLAAAAEGDSQQRHLAAAATAPVPGVKVFTDQATGNNITLLTWPVPPQLNSSTAFRAAMEGLQLAGEEDEPGLTPQQALAADTAAARAAGKVGLAASPGTVVAWVYGDGLTDSGGSSGVVVTDQISLSARVASIGSNWIELDRDLPFPVQAGWDAVVHQYVPQMQGGGIEALTIAFDHTPVGPHFTDKGYNAIQFTGGANMWIRQVSILNSDNSVFFNWVDHSTVEDLIVDVTAPRWVPTGWQNAENGHHPLCLTASQANRLTGVHIRAKYIHDLTVCSGASMNVFESCSGRDVNLDQHRSAPFANLFTDIDVGFGTRWYYSGGSTDKGAYSGVGTTFWNVRPSAWAPPPQPMPVLPPPTPSPRSAPPPQPRSPPPPPSPRPRPPPPPPSPRPPFPPSPPRPSPPLPPPSRTVNIPKPKRPAPPPQLRRSYHGAPTTIRPAQTEHRPPPGQRVLPSAARPLPRPPMKRRSQAAAVSRAPPPKFNSHPKPGQSMGARSLRQDAHCLGQQLPAGRKLTAVTAVRTLPLPPCIFGPKLVFVGSFSGDQCAKMGWLVLERNSSMPANLWQAQRALRGLPLL